MSHRNLTILLLAVLVVSLQTSRVFSKTFYVTNNLERHEVVVGDALCGDSLGCSLRQAIEETNALPDSDTIIISQTITVVRLYFGPLRVTGNRLILMGESGQPIIDGLGNPYASHTLSLESDSNRISNLTFRRSRGNAINISSSFNILGDTGINSTTVFTDNGLDLEKTAAITISGTQAAYNAIINCHIGVDHSGLSKRPNKIGVSLESGAHNNFVGGDGDAKRNIISGNSKYGIAISTGALNNQISGNYIGTSITGITALGNTLGGILLSDGAKANTIGGDSIANRNVISGNEGDGVLLRDVNTTGNYIFGNYIGLDRTGRLPRGNGGNGIVVTDGASQNFIGDSYSPARNVISGNDRNGIYISGVTTQKNVVQNNLVGTEYRGVGPMTNGTVDGDGVVITDGARLHQIGGLGIRDINVISGNNRIGLVIEKHARENIVEGNFIGVNISGNSSLLNGTGVMIRGEASSNRIGGETLAHGNLISGNRADQYPYGAGVILYDEGTTDNHIAGNYIGTDLSGTRALRNGSAGIIIGNGASYNIIGGATAEAGNLISGNGADSYTNGLGRGIHIEGLGTDYNQITGNRIGTTANGSGQLPNRGHGIGVFGGAKHNQIGAINGYKNLIANNDGFGIYFSDVETLANPVINTSFLNNDSLGIVLRGGAQRNLLPPVILSASDSTVTGEGLSSSGTITLYKAAPDPSDSGEGEIEIGGTLILNGNGSFTFSIDQTYGALLNIGDLLTAFTTDSEGNSSAFSQNITVDAATDSPHDTQPLPFSFSLAQNYPNPFNPSTTINFSLSKVSQVYLVVYNLLGQRTKTLLSATLLGAGNHSIKWNGDTDLGHSAASGVYMYRLIAGKEVAVRKLSLIK
ncbi:MAG: T9SS type A sorting domain-containing protein [candidate division Zixibacteria bacterium]|mgnify:CR=1 FL=1|nr:T9SS type A sorting domain-containing protein [candidate division Zixibacteria bacterium]